MAPPAINSASFPTGNISSPIILYSILAGYAGFASALSLCTFAQLKMGISTGTRPPVPSLLGVASVALASLSSHKAAVSTYTLLQPDQNRSRKRKAEECFGEMIPLGAVQASKQAIRICCLGLLTFKLLGGRFWSISPSSYTHLGSFARFSLPATQSYATPSQRSATERLGKLFGCHTCGSHRFFHPSSVKFHADHQPPLAVAQQMNKRWWRHVLKKPVRQRFYPQCVLCSGKQGGLLAKATASMSPSAMRNGAAATFGPAHFHGLRLRIYHFTGAVIAGFTVCGAEDDDIRNDGNAPRFENIEKRMRRCWRDLSTCVRDFKDFYFD